jgi:hypothetical protein
MPKYYSIVSGATSNSIDIVELFDDSEHTVKLVFVVLSNPFATA